MRTVIIGPTGAHLRTVNVATGASGATGVWETVHYAVSGPSGSFETVQVASARDNRFKSLAIPGFTGTVTPDPAPAGGGGAPEWVPADAKIYIDLVNDRAWTEDDGEVAINTLLGTDANTVNGWGTTLYDIGNLTADGYVIPDDEPAFIGAALEKVLVGMTMRVLLTQHNEGGSEFFVMSEDGNTYLEIDHNSDGTLEAYTSNSSWDIQTDNTGNSTTVPGAKNCMAITLTPTRLDMALNGSDVITQAIESSDLPSPLVAAVLASQSALQSITIYDALPSTAGLSALSVV